MEVKLSIPHTSQCQSSTKLAILAHQCLWCPTLCCPSELQRSRACTGPEEAIFKLSQRATTNSPNRRMTKQSTLAGVPDPHGPRPPPTPQLSALMRASLNKLLPGDVKAPFLGLGGGEL